MSKARIMVVEDEGVVALQIKEALEGLGYEIPVVALSGEEAVEKVMETEPDLVLMDIQLKGALNGIESAKGIRQRFDVPVVYLTAFSDAETLEAAQLTEPYGYVLKPFEERSLHAIIQMALFKHRRTRGEREIGWWMSAMAASMLEAVVICDAKGYVKFVNSAAETLLGVRQEEMKEKQLGEVVRLVDGDTSAPQCFPVSEPLLEGKSTLRGNCRIVLDGEKKIPVEVSASPLHSPEGTLFGILYVFRETGERERIENLVLRELEELARARKKSTLSRGAEVPGIRCEQLSRTTGTGGGDSLGFFRLDATHVGFFAADVLGQGALSTLFSLLLHLLLSPDPQTGGILAKRDGEDPNLSALSPGEVVGELNRRFFLQDDANPHFTIVYGVTDAATGATRLVRAGSPSPLLQKADGTVRLLTPEGCAVGLFRESEVVTEEFLLERGDRLILSSDGLVECTNPSGESFSIARLIERVSALKEKPLGELVESLSAELDGWRGAAVLEDDLSLLALEKE